jgi:ABC-type phosphate/phosphonate transport system substrate-binding protein
MTGGALFAALPMYDFPEVAPANDALWRAIAERLIAKGVDAPLRLRRGGDMSAEWSDPGLLFGQTCGYPYMKALRETVALVATPEYAFPGCEGATHCSFLVRRADDTRRGLVAFRGSVAAINDPTSNSGMNLFRAAIAPIAGGESFFARAVTTGSHAASLRAVAEGDADLAAIDCVSFALIARAEPALAERIAIIARSPSSPCLPFIASARLPQETLASLREALFAALADPDLAEARAAIGLRGARAAIPADYGRVLTIEHAAEAAGYAHLA